MKKVYRNVGEGVRRLVAEEFCHPDWQRLSVAAHRRSLQDQIEQLVAVSQLDRRQIQILPHQVDAVMTTINRMRTRAILADEVGLGKTIEAGLIIKEYMARGLARRVLILTPAPLTTQWRGELRYKFGEVFAVADTGKPGPDEQPFLGFDQHDTLIASLDMAKQPANAAALLARPWDLVVVDEAHRLKNSATLGYKFVKQLRTRFILLLTATPVQNSLFELYNLTDLVQEGLLGTFEHFREAFVADKQGRVLRDAPRLAELLRRVMVRHRRADVGITFADRRVETVLLDGTPDEMALHQAVIDFVRGDEAGAGHPERGFKTLTYIRLSRMLASSPAALAQTVRGMALEAAEATEGVQLLRIGQLAQAMRTNSKTQALLRVLEETADKAIVFTSFYETQRFLQQQLAGAGHEVILFSGLMSQREKDAAVQQFREPGRQVLLCTDAGSEGVNLQFCNVLVNYDLPWNPMRVEQRIGRVHRIGQQRDVVIVNMAIRDTIEEYILELLSQKLHLFNTAVGETDLILSQLRGVESFERSVIDVIAKAREPRELRYQFEALGEQLALAKQAADQLKAFDAKTLSLLDLSALEGTPHAS
ncbi:MAG: SNF2-related protein [Candidatus Sericytochromatia bacterium]|nr:SNF2-related protein [Candidatus Sericytochromatia bacterium]